MFQNDTPTTVPGNKWKLCKCKGLALSVFVFVTVVLHPDFIRHDKVHLVSGPIT